MIRTVVILSILIVLMVALGVLKSLRSAVDDWQSQREYNDYIISCTGVDLSAYPKKGDAYETLTVETGALLEADCRPLLTDSE